MAPKTPKPAQAPLEILEDGSVKKELSNGYLLHLTPPLGLHLKAISQKVEASGGGNFEAQLAALETLAVPVADQEPLGAAFDQWPAHVCQEAMEALTNFQFFRRD